MIGPWQMVMSDNPFSRMTRGWMRRLEIRGVDNGDVSWLLGVSLSASMLSMILRVAFMLSNSVVVFLAFSRYCFRDEMDEMLLMDMSW